MKNKLDLMILGEIRKVKNRPKHLHHIRCESSLFNIINLDWQTMLECKRRQSQFPGKKSFSVYLPLKICQSLGFYKIYYKESPLSTVSISMVPGLQNIVTSSEWDGLRKTCSHQGLKATGAPKSNSTT